MDGVFLNYKNVYVYRKLNSITIGHSIPDQEAK
jgi:hypothetical protein